MLLAFTLSWEHGLIAVLLFLVCLAVGLLLYRIDDKIEQRREKAQQLATMLSGAGFVDIPDLLNRYSRGDYDGVWKQVEVMWAKYNDPTTGKAALAAALTRMLKDALEDDDRRPRVLEILENYQLTAEAKDKVAEDAALARAKVRDTQSPV